MRLPSPPVVSILSAFGLVVAAAPLAQATDAAPAADRGSWQQTDFPTRFGGLSAIDIEGDATVAVGFGIADPFRFTALAAVWDGERWDRQRVRVGDVTEVQLTDVDLISSKRGWAVGHGFGDGSEAVAARWNGSRWRGVPTDALVGDVGFHGVVAVARDDVWAAGQEQVGFTLRPTLAHYDGASWAPVEVPPLEEVGPHTALTAITAESRRSVWAVGIGGVCLHYDGDTWTQVELPKIDGHFVELNDVAAFGRDDVWAVGYQIGDDANHPVALRWDGTEWLVMDVPLDAGAELIDLAHTAAGPVAVGYESADVLQFYGLRLDADGPARPLGLPPGKDALFAATTDETGTRLWVVGSGAVGSEGKISPYAALRS